MNGVIILDKPEGFTSFDAVAVMRGLAHERKIGHTGTLDPMATGVLPLLLGRAAKAADLLEDTSKRYRAGFRLGEQTDTGDRTGAVVKTDGTPVSRERLEKCLPRFRGEILQLPPMYSAVSVNGQRLYKLARQGIEVEREKRPVTIETLLLLEYDEASREGVLEVACSKGTYIRTLIEDLAEAAGSCGTMTQLRRTSACGFSVEDAATLDGLRALAAEGTLESVLRPVDTLFQSLPASTVSPAQSTRFLNGGALGLERMKLPRIALRDGIRVRLYGNSSRGKPVFLGLGCVSLADNEMKICKLFAEKDDLL